jgi:hypothetical protein
MKSCDVAFRRRTNRINNQLVTALNDLPRNARVAITDVGKMCMTHCIACG